MYGKFFASAFEGSMYGAGPEVFSIWSYVISHTVNSRVEINPIAVAPKIGMPVEAVKKALEFLEKKDPDSRSKDCEGRRMVKEGQFSYFIPNHRVYLMIKKPEDLRKYNAQKKRESREKRAKMNGSRSKTEIGLADVNSQVDTGRVPHEPDTPF